MKLDGGSWESQPIQNCATHEKALCDLVNWNGSNKKKSNNTKNKVIPLGTTHLNFVI